MKWNSLLYNLTILGTAFVITSLETLAADDQLNKLKIKREKSWSSYIKRGNYSLFIDNDSGISHLPYHERQQILNQRNKKWDILLNYYQEADYLEVTKRAPMFYGWKTHRGAAAYLSGLSRAKFNDLKNSLKDLNRSIRYKFKNPQVYFEKGKVLLSLDLLDQSYEAFEESIKRKNQQTLSRYYLGWIKEIQKDYQAALKHYEDILKDKNLDPDTTQSVQIRRAEIYDQLTQDSKLDTRVRNSILGQKVILPAKAAIELDPSTTNAKRLREFLQKIEQKFGLPSLVPFKIGSMGHYLRLNQYLSYNTNVTNLPEGLSEFRDSWLSNTIFVYKHFFSSFKGVTHTPEMRINTISHFEKNIPGIYGEDTYLIGPSIRNSIKHNFWGIPSNFIFDIETSYIARDTNQDHNNEFFSRSLKLNIGENLKILNFGSTNIKLRQDFRSYFDSRLDTKTFTFFVNQLISLRNNRTISLIGNADFTTAETALNSTNSYMARADYLHPRLLGNWELQTAMTILGTDTKEQSEIRGFETNISYEMEWRRKFFKEFEFAINYNYSINNSKDKENFSYDKHIIALELQYIPNF